jgi:rhodanese-related sulfurtransferase
MQVTRQTAPQDHESTRVPTILKDGTIQLDPWWGTIQPMSLDTGIITIGELELISYMSQKKYILIDTRRPEYVAQTGVIPGAVAIHWEHIAAEVKKLDIVEDSILVLYCNGPQCAATPRAIEKLLDDGWVPEKLMYYRGGLMDWMGMGLPVEE